MADPQRVSLCGRRILVARAPTKAKGWVEALEARGASVETREMFTLESMAGEARSQRSIDEIEVYDWILFTSQSGLGFFLRALQTRGIRLNGLPAKFGVVGPQTARAIEAAGATPDVVPRQTNALGLAAALEGELGESDRVLIVRPQDTFPELAERLQAFGAEVHSVPFYRNRPARGLESYAKELTAGAFDAAVFGSPSAFSHLFAACDRPLERLASIALVAIGETTASAIRDLGCAVAAVAREPTPEGIADAVERTLSP